jgi:predicted porin
MKKHLIAAAVAAAVAAPAMAQVTVYGNIDTGFQMRDSDSINRTTGVTTSTEASAITYSSDSSSRLGFRATEDLGAGLKATLVLETGLGSNDVATKTPAATSLGSRLKYVELAGGFGALRVGFQTSTTKDAWAVADAGGASNVDGNWDDLSGNVFDKRVTAATWITPAMGGLSAQLGLTKDTTKVTGRTDTDGGSGYMAALNYNAGPLNTKFAYNKADTKSPAVAAVAADAAADHIVVGSAAVAQVNNDEKRWVLAANYNLGAATVYAGYADRELRSSINAALNTDENYWTIGLAMPMGATSLFISHSQGDSKTGANATQDRDALQLGARYNLSKRTNLYGVYGQTNWDRTANVNGTEDTAFAIGINHKF